MVWFAEIDLLLAPSACPYGCAALPPEQWRNGLPPARPIRVEVHDTGVDPLGWPYAAAGP